MVTGLSPAAGLTRGVTRVLVYGSGLAGTVLVRVGATLDSQFTIKSDHELELTIPAGAPGTVDVRAEALVGWSPVSHADRFTYQTTAPPPTTTPATANGFSPVSATYVSRSEGWVLGTVPCGTKQCFKLLHTTDDGTSWSPALLPAIGPQSPGGRPLKVRFADSEDGWVFTTSPGNGPADAWSTHTGGQHWSAVNFPVKSASPLGVEDIEASAGVVDAAVQVGAEVDIFSSPISSDAWHLEGGPFALGAGPAPGGELALQGTSGWFVEDNRVAVSGARREASGLWAAWTPPCSGTGGPVLLSAVTNSKLDAVCTEGLWTGHVVTVHLLTSDNGGASFGTDRSTPFTSVQVAAASSPSTVAVGSTPPTGGPAAGLEMTFNGGASWHTVYGRVAQGWLEMAFTTVDRGVAIVQGTAQSTGNTMVSTTDGGEHWYQVKF